MFLGRYEHRLDSKGRLTIPARYRELLEDGAYITQGFDNNLIVMPPAYFDQMYQSVNQTSMTNPDARLIKRLIFSNADRVDVDKVGRILIQQFLRSAAGLVEDVILVGVGDYFEVWTPERWEKQSQILMDTDANNERFATLNISV